MTDYDLFGMVIGAVFVAFSAAYLTWVLIHPERF